MTIIRLYKNYKPSRFFSWIAFLLCLIATLFLIPVLCEYAATGLVLRFPTLIVCGFVYLGAIQSFFTGMMLSTMKQKNRQDYEMNLIQLENNYNQIKNN